MAIYNLSDIIENLKDEKEDYEKKLQAWKNFKIVTKKDGTPFSVLSKNFEGASIGKYYVVEDSMHPYLTVNYQTDRTGYNRDHIQIFHFLDELPESDERRKEYKPQFMRQTVTKSFDEIREAVDNYMDELEKNIESYNEQLEKASTAYENYAKAIKEARKQLRIDCGLSENETYGNTLYYSVKELLNK